MNWITFIKDNSLRLLKILTITVFLVTTLTLSGYSKKYVNLQIPLILTSTSFATSTSTAKPTSTITSAPTATPASTTTLASTTTPTSIPASLDNSSRNFDANNWGDAATWFTGIITLGLFIIGFCQIRNERLLRELQFKREQAQKISAWIVKEDVGKLFIAISNQSHQPVYQMVVTVAAIGDRGGQRGRSSNHVCISVAPPGLGYVTAVADYHGMGRKPGVEIAFIDSASVNWVRQAHGELIEINMSTADYYQLDVPRSWDRLETEMPVE
ncbi:MAG: hypothetical protein JNM55_23045 [Anaerolineales bacterium]|nr:hypothetical protein [Anaerolineales bacterium]